MIILLNILFILTILFIIWWFWLYKPKAAEIIESGEVTIEVENGVYKPDAISTTVGKELVINFLLKDDAHCAKTVIFSDFDKSLELAKGETKTIKLVPEKQGEFQFACPMGMYRGKLNVLPAPALEIIVEGGVYKPNLIRAKVGQAVNLKFIRNDPSRCAESVIFKQLERSEEIPLGKEKLITIVPEQTGEIDFSCEMGMYRGKLIIEN